VSVLALLLLAGLLLAGGFLAGFVWAARSGQFDDTATPAVRILLDDDFTPGERERPGARRERDE
jgi:cbb3-type cytochrome oxidase maturation protein